MLVCVCWEWMRHATGLLLVWFSQNVPLKIWVFKINFFFVVAPVVLHLSFCVVCDLSVFCVVFVFDSFSRISGFVSEAKKLFEVFLVWGFPVRLVLLKWKRSVNVALMKLNVTLGNEIFRFLKSLLLVSVSFFRSNFNWIAYFNNGQLISRVIAQPALFLGGFYEKNPCSYLWLFLFRRQKNAFHGVKSGFYIVAEMHPPSVKDKLDTPSAHCYPFFNWNWTFQVDETKSETFESDEDLIRNWKRGALAL